MHGCSCRYSASGGLQVRPSPYPTPRPSCCLVRSSVRLSGIRELIAASDGQRGLDRQLGRAVAAVQPLRHAPVGRDSAPRTASWPSFEVEIASRCARPSSSATSASRTTEVLGIPRGAAAPPLRR
jgi:hypothetical protein